MEPPVAFACGAPTHQIGESGPDKLTIYDGKWAYCPFDVKAEGHVWEPTGGRTLSMLRHAAVVRHRDQGKGSEAG